MTATQEVPVVVGGTGSGILNGHKFDSAIRISVDPLKNIVETEIVIDDIPELGNSLLASSCTSYAMSTGGIFAPAYDGAKRMVDITGMPYSVTADYVHFNDAGEEVGRLSQSIEIDGGDEDGSYSAHPYLSGYYNGPKDLKYSPGYAIFLRQAGRGVIEGNYAQTIIGDSGRVHAHVRRTYRYDNDNTLPFDQVWLYKLLDVNIDVENGKRKFTSHVAASFRPAEPVHA